MGIKDRGRTVRARGRQGGLHLVLSPGQPARDKQLAAQLGKLGVALQTVRKFGGNSDEVLLGYGHMDAGDIEQAVGLLGQALSMLQNAGRRVRQGELKGAVDLGSRLRA